MKSSSEPWWMIGLARWKKVLDAPREDEDIFTAADHWLTTLCGQERLAHQVIRLIEEQIAKRDVSP
jgi:hypothetical protein